MYAKQSVLVNNLISDAKKQYYSDLISSCGSDQYRLFKIVESLNKGHSEKQFPNSSSADALADFFQSKINVIRQDLSQLSTKVTNPLLDTVLVQSKNTLDVFTPVRCDELASLVKRISTKSCRLDPLTSNVLKGCFPLVLPVITEIVNESLESATVPDCLKSASHQPRLKKPSLDPSEYSNFRPISNLRFVAKAIEKVVAFQTNYYILYMYYITT